MASTRKPALAGAHALLACALLAGAALARDESRTLRLQVATSLAPAFDVLARGFERANPGVRVESDTGASLLLVRRILDLGARADVVAVADPEVLDELLVPAGRVEGYVVFAGGRLGLLHGPASKYAAELTAESWHRILRRPRVRVGRADPDAAPAGYRTLMLFDLAERHHRVTGLSAELRRAASEKFVRGSLAQLAALVQAGEVDYVFDYETSAAPRGLTFFALPPEIDFGDPARAEAYGAVSVEVAGRRPGERVRVRGAPIGYAAAVVAGSPRAALAARFVRYLVGDEGRRVLKARAFRPYARPVVVGKGPPLD